MPKYFKKRYSRSSRDKYSVEQTAMAVGVGGAAQSAVAVVPASSTQGMRKIKHLTISVSNTSGESVVATAYWALVFVPQGTTPNPLAVGTISSPASFYEPNQYVMNCGVFDLTAGPTRISTPLSRNLNSGDSVYLIIANPDSTNSLTLACVVRYAITLQ